MSRKIFKEITANNFPNLVKDMNVHFQEVQQTKNSIIPGTKNYLNMKRRGAQEGSGAKRRWQREERVGASWEEIIFAKHKLLC